MLSGRGLTYEVVNTAKSGATGRAARRYLEVADRWQRRVEHWTRTTTGPLSDRPYYMRVTVNGDADEGTDIQVPDGGPLVDERRIVDPSLLVSDRAHR